jgi:hypothetical protein
VEDALISPAGFMILSGADLTDASTTEKIYQHVTETVEVSTDDKIRVSNKPYFDNTDKDSVKYGDTIYVMKLDADHNAETEPYIYSSATEDKDGDKPTGKYILVAKDDNAVDGNAPKAGDLVLVDYYVERTSGAQQIDITPDKFGGNFYLEASTLFKNENGKDVPAEFIIPNCKVQSNFTFTMASSGDPSAFTFTMDAFPDYTRFNPTKKVLAALQIITDAKGDDKEPRSATKHDYTAPTQQTNLDD